MTTTKHDITVTKQGITRMMRLIKIEVDRIAQNNDYIALTELYNTEQDLIVILRKIKAV